MSMCTSLKRYRIRTFVPVTRFTGHRDVLSPGVIVVEALAAGERVLFEETRDHVDLVRGEIERLARIGKIERLLMHKEKGHVASQADC